MERKGVPYQRRSRRSPPPPPRRGLSVLGRASLTLIARPPRLVPFNPLIAASASAESLISTNAKPRERPVSRSVIKLTRSTAPYASKAERMDSSVAPKSKFPTKSFFMISPTFESELGGGRQELSARRGRTIKRDFNYTRVFHLCSFRKHQRVRRA